MTDYPLTTELREKIYKPLMDVTLELLETGEITVEDSQEVSEFALGLELELNFSDL